MYFVVIMAFALILSDTLPPKQCNLFPDLPVTEGRSLIGTLAIIFGQLIAVGVLAAFARRKAISKLDGTPEGHDDASDTFVFFQQVFLFVLAGLLILNMVFTPWPTLVRVGWGLGKIPMLGDLFLLAPFFISLFMMWIILYPVEMKFRAETFTLVSDSPTEPTEKPKRNNDAIAALEAAKQRKPRTENSLGGYLLDKFRHQVLILAVPMSIIVLAKHLIHDYADTLIKWLKELGLPIELPIDPTIRGLFLNTALGTVSVIVLALAPLMLRFIWATEPLPAGPLRDRFTATCRRIGLRYREILLWHTHGMAVNAAVMGFITPLRYILVSDALLETMDEEEIEAVFGHEAGHVRHWHLPFFGLFAVVSMYAGGGAMHLLLFIDLKINNGISRLDPAILQLVALGVLFAMWLFGFSWLSRKFERQADLFGVRCITPDMKNCLAQCPVHGVEKTPGLCISAANLFGRTLYKIADLNGIPREAPSWRHGSIESRCKLIETFSSDVPAMERFDRLLRRIKIGLILVSVIGSVVAVWLYYEPVAKALNW